MQALQDYFKLQKEIYDYFGYEEDWCIFPLEDLTGCYWKLIDNESTLIYAENPDDLEDEDKGNYCAVEVYRQRFLNKWVYRGEDYTMVLVDTQTDGNKFLEVLSNNKEVK